MCVVLKPLCWTEVLKILNDIKFACQWAVDLKGIISTCSLFFLHLFFIPSFLSFFSVAMRANPKFEEIKTSKIWFLVGLQKEK